MVDPKIKLMNGSLINNFKLEKDCIVNKEMITITSTEIMIQEKLF